uniref:ER membrane protein complex subunit 10 n=1 Tax=Timema shepardi TaxID=629360 RepID=A0A7R9G4L0_TIMSH|nr:unnamed protein product [Timema shepardi]
MYQLETDHGGLLTISLRHALGQEPFVERGRITIQSINSQSVALQQSALSNADRDKLKALAEEDGLYRLEAVVRTHDSKETLFLTFVKALNPPKLPSSGDIKSDHWLLELCAGNILFREINECVSHLCLLSRPLTSIPSYHSPAPHAHDGYFHDPSPVFPLTTHLLLTLTMAPHHLLPLIMCALVESHMSDVVTLSLSQDNNIIAVSLSTQPIAGCGSLVDQQHLKTFNTTVVFRHMETGPVPDTATYVQKLEREREARERGDTKDNRSFLAKYVSYPPEVCVLARALISTLGDSATLWMYIVPVLIFVLLSGAANPEGAAGGGAR